ncbi:MAG: hypothetical protein CFE34_16765 [Rhodobacteraceae bacterium PARR1]|nr:MAG: hypothetical protein CFE34_16765 [Rhodobacteraceae bacterium PARR1]
MNGPMNDPGLPPFSRTPAGAASATAQVIDTDQLARAARRQAGLVAKSAGIGAAAALLLILGSVPRYSASETILLDEERSDLLNQVSAMPNAQRTDAAVQSEIEILGSQLLALAVVDRLQLHKDAGFMDPPLGLTGQVGAALRGVIGLVSGKPEGGSPPADPDLAAREAAAAILREGVTVSRIGRSFVLEVGFSDPDPVRAATVARAYGDAYVAFQLSTTSEVSANAGKWISDRLSQLARQTLEAASAVQDFRARHNLVHFQGMLLSDQQQSELASALVTASAELAEVKARLDNFRALLSSGDVIAVSALETKTPSDVALQAMRTDYLDNRRRWLAISESAGPDHPQATKLKSEMDLTERAIGEELDRAAGAIAANFNIATSRVASLQDDLRAFAKGSTGDVREMGQLAQLEAIADTYSTVYRQYLERYEIATQQQNFPIASVSIISPAEVPKDPSSPQRKVMLALGILLGGLVGLVIAARRELAPPLLRTQKDLRDRLGLPCAGLIPARKRGAKPHDGLALQRTLSQLGADITRFAAGQSGRIIAIVPVEGGETEALPALVETLAMGEDRVLVVNAGGLGQGVAQRLGALPQVEMWKPADLHRILPQSRSGRDVSQTADLRVSYRLILLCLPPLMSPGFPVALASIADGSVLLVPWGRVTPDLLREAVAAHGAALRPVITTVLTGANLSRARLYMRRGDYEERVLHA